MKPIIRTTLLLLALLLPATATAHDFEVGGIYYNINGTNATVTYKGTSYHQYSNEYTGDVTIPSTVSYNGTTYSVTSIGYRAFWDCWELTSVTIPNSVTAIGEWAFAYCTVLTTVNIPNSVTSIGGYAFYGTPWYDNQPDGLVYVGLIAYNYKGTMPEGTSITIREGTFGIASYAFNGCSGLTSVTIPNSVATIGGHAFTDCSGLTSVTIPNSVTSIGFGTFSYCSGLTSVTIGNSVTSIGGEAFCGCSALTSVTIPNSVTSIGSRAFLCIGLTNIIVASDNPKYDSRDNCNAIIETSSNTLVAGCKNTIIPNSVTAIGSDAFRCSGLTSVTIPNSVTAIGWSAFESCSSLTSLTIPNSVTSIGDYAFSYCSGLTEIYCLALVPPTISYDTFDDCYGATLFVPESSVEAYKVANYWNNFSNIVAISAVSGDADGDGFVSIADVTAIIDFLLGISSEEFYEEAADMDGDGIVSIADVTDLIDLLLHN